MENTGSLHKEVRGAQATCELPTCCFLARVVGVVTMLLFLSLSSSICETNKRLAQIVVVRQMKMYIRYLANSSISINITENTITLLTRQPVNQCEA